MTSILTETRRLLVTHGLRPKKRWGQSFLVDRNILRKILEAGELHPEDRVLEVGAGVGTLTHALAERCRRVVAVEIDARLLQIVQEVLRGTTQVTLVHGDALRLDFGPLLGEERPWKVIANLPYSIVSPLITRLLALSPSFSLMLFMVQKEVAERLIASPGKRNYGSLSVFVHYYADARVVARVPRTAFYPRPRVDSVLLKLEPLSRPRVTPKDTEMFFRLIRTAFAHRRKTLQNALTRSGWIPLDREEIQETLARVGIDPRRRGETLTLQEFHTLADELVSEMEGAAA